MVKSLKRAQGCGTRRQKGSGRGSIPGPAGAGRAGTARGRGDRGEGSLGIEGCPHGTAECPPAAAASALGARASPARAVPRFDGRPSPHSFSPGSVNPEGAGGGAAPPGTAWPTPVPGKSHQLGAEPPWWGTVSSARRCLADGAWGQEWDAVTLHCGTARGWSHRIPAAPPAWPFLLLYARRWRGRRNGAGGMFPAFPRPTLPSVLMIWCNLFCCPSWLVGLVSVRSWGDVAPAAHRL